MQQDCMLCKIRAKSPLSDTIAEPYQALSSLQPCMLNPPARLRVGSVPCLPQVRNMFTTIVNPDASSFKSIRSGILSALAAHLLYGRAALAADGSAGSACVSVLSRVGAAALQADVADLGQRLAGVAAVCEAVHGDVLALLAARAS
jgi:hypothetical protein